MYNMLDLVFEIALKSYQQEIERNKMLINRADFLMKWLVLFVSIFNFSVPIVVKEICINFRSPIFVILYGILMVCLLIAMIVLVLVNFPQKVKHYPLGYDYLEKIKESIQDKDFDLEILYKKVLLQDVITKKLDKTMTLLLRE